MEPESYYLVNPGIGVGIGIPLVESESESESVVVESFTTLITIYPDLMLIERINQCELG